MNDKSKAPSARSAFEEAVAGINRWSCGRANNAKDWAQERALSTAIRACRWWDLAGVGLWQLRLLVRTCEKRKRARELELVVGCGDGGRS
jgi:hypothetical protein